MLIPLSNKYEKISANKKDTLYFPKCLGGGGYII